MKRTWILLWALVLLGPGRLAADEGTLVTLQPLRELLFHPREEAPATVISRHNSLLGAEVAGVVREIAVEVGDQVTQGAVLLVIDPWEYQSRVNQAEAELNHGEAQLRLADQQLQRARTLVGSRQASQESLDLRDSEWRTATAQVARQRAALAEAKERLARCTVRAPFAGVISQRAAQVGAWVAPGQPLLRLLELNELELAAHLDPKAALEARGVDDWQFQHPGGVQAARLRVLLPLQDERSRSQEARLLLQPPNPLPGATGRLTWRSPIPHLPAWLLVRRDNTLGLFLAREGRAEFLPLPQAQEGRPAPLPNPPEGNVVVAGREGLVHGVRLRIQ